MAADVNDLVCLGLGSWSSVNSLPTLGFGSSAVVVPDDYRPRAVDVTYAGPRSTSVTVLGPRSAIHRYIGPRSTTKKETT